MHKQENDSDCHVIVYAARELTKAECDFEPHCTHANEQNPPLLPPWLGPAPTRVAGAKSLNTMNTWGL